MAIDSSKVEIAARQLRVAAEQGEPCDPVRALIGDDNLGAAYAVQDLNTAAAIENGRRLVGRKIGLTAKVVQAQFNVDSPDYGMLFADMDVPEGEEIPWRGLMQPKAEAEIAFVLGADLDQEQLTSADAMNAIAYAVAAIEIVDSRIKDWQIGITDTVADNASAGLFVLGNQPRKLGEFDPRLCGMVMECRGEPISVGAGVACLGSPISSALWLAKMMAKVGRPLAAGDIILSGALGPMAPISPGDVIETRISGLGSVRAAFSWD